MVPSKTFTFRASYTNVAVDLDVGDFRTQLVSANLDFTAGPDVSWKNLVQFDTESNTLGLQTRLRWILEPGRDLFLVGLFGFQRERSDASFVRGEQQVAFKLTYTLRF